MDTPQGHVRQTWGAYCPRKGGLLVKQTFRFDKFTVGQFKGQTGGCSHIIDFVPRIYSVFVNFNIYLFN